jgi:AcrR family transcriptional regulator
MPRPDVSDERRPQVIEAALKVFIRKGYRKVTMPDIAREAGLSIGGVYWYFKGKDEIVQAMMEDVFQKDLSALDLLIEEGSSSAQRLKSFVAAFVENYNEVQWMNSIGIEFYGESVHNPKAQAFIQNYLSRYRRALAQLIEQGIQRGEFRPVDAEDTANAILALEEGLSLLVVTDPGNIRWTKSFQIALDLMIDGLTNIAPPGNGMDE